MPRVPAAGEAAVEAHTQALIDRFGDTPVGLGKSSVLEHVGGTFVDAVIRANVSFQLSRLISPMLRAATWAAGSDTAATTPSCSGTGSWHPAGVRPPRTRRGEGELAQG